MLNKSILQGRLVREVDMRTTGAGVPVASFTIAWSEKYKETETKCFLPCTAWRATAEFISKYFAKGQEICVEGSLSTREWEDKEGNKRSAIELTVDKAHFCGSKGSGGSESSGANSQGFIPVDGPEADGDLPF